MSKKNITVIFTVALLVSSVIPAYGVNHLKNPSLETWTNIRQPLNWTVEDTIYTKVFKDSARVFHGTYSAKLIRMQAGTTNNKGILQQCTIPGRGRYIARVRFFDNNDSLSGGLTITWRTSTGSFISSWAITYTVNSPSWQVVQRISASDTSPANAAIADFIVRTYGATGTPAGGTLSVDSLFFERVTGIEEEIGNWKLEIGNFRVSPNPFSFTTLINFSINPANFNAIKIYDATGNMVRKLTSLNHTNGAYKAMWDGRNEKGALSAPGVYFIVLETNNAEAKTVKTLYLR